MVFQDFSFEPVEEKQEFDQEAEDTLSLSDLPLHSKASDDNWDYDFSKDDQSSSFEDDLFEFFSEEFTSSTYSTDKNSIIFCGKLIPYKGATVAEKSQRATNSKLTEKKKSSTFLPWRPKSLNKSRTMYDAEKVSILATPMKSRWYLFAFGVGRFPSMETSDMKKRQSKKSTPAARAQVVSSPPQGREISRSRSRSRKSMWSLFGVLGCSSSHHTNDLQAKRSFDCFLPSV